METYTGDRPGCYKCKEAIEPKDDYYILVWRGKTWAWEINYHRQCFLKAIQDGDFKEPDASH